MLTLEIDWGSRILTEAWGLLFWRNKAVEFFPKKTRANDPTIA